MSRIAQKYGRSVEEWVAASPDAAIPPRVRTRIVERFDRCCAECGRLLGGRLGCEIDHKVALANGGEHREKNLRPLCKECHAPKTAADRKVKARADKSLKTSMGIKPSSHQPVQRNKRLLKKVSGEVIDRATGKQIWP